VRLGIHAGADADTYKGLPAASDTAYALAAKAVSEAQSSANAEANSHGASSLARNNPQGEVSLEGYSQTERR